MIKRVWRGWTVPENADAYFDVLCSQVIPSIEAKNIAGFRSIEVLREECGDEVEFSTVMTFDSIENVVAFQGDDYARCYVPDVAQKVLKRWDDVCRHYAVVECRNYPAKR